jgi:hypothetical protein
VSEVMRFCKHHQIMEPAEWFRIYKNGVMRGMCRRAESELDKMRREGRLQSRWERAYSRNDPPDPLNQVAKEWRGPVDPLPWRVSL